MRITAENLSKRFQREWIFKNFNYQFNPGIYAIVGPNGSGKSTLLQILWGQMLASSGNLTYEVGSKPVPAEEIYKQISIATPYMDLIEEFTLPEMIQFHFRFKESRNKMSTGELIQAFELTHAQNKLISNFSSGMKQRLKLGLAFYSNTETVFLDEPTTNLDKKSIEWYQQQRDALPGDVMLIIASNQEHEYPSNSEKIDILRYKKGY